MDTLHNPAAGTIPPRAWGQQVRSNFAALLGPPACEMARFGVSLLNNTVTAIGFPGGALGDTDNMHDPVTNNDRITAQTAGMYLVAGATVFPDAIPPGSGFWSLRLQKNGVDQFPVNQPAIGSGTLRMGLNVVRFVALNVGDWVRLTALNSTGATRLAGFRFMAWRLGPITPSTGFTYADLDTIQQIGYGRVAQHELGDQIRTNFESLINRPICVLGKSANQSISNDGEFHDVNFETETSDVFGMHAAGSPQLIQLHRGGTWLVVGNLTFAGNSAGTRSLRFYTNSTFSSVLPFFHEVLQFPPNGSESAGLCFVSMVRIGSGEQLVLQARQTSAGALNVLTNSQFGVAWLGE